MRSHTVAIFAANGLELLTVYHYTRKTFIPKNVHMSVALKDATKGEFDINDDSAILFHIFFSF